MANLPSWCDMLPAQVVGTHELYVCPSRALDLPIGVDSLADVVPEHYASKDRKSAILKKLGKPQAAAYLQAKLPTLKNIRSGDIGEILATEYVDAHTFYSVPIKRLRWKDHRNMAMRGDDLIGIRVRENGRLHFLKGEAKSRQSLQAAIVAEARGNLDKDGGLPAPHALSFVADRLAEGGNEALADAIYSAQLGIGITDNDVRHLTFVFSGNSPTNFLQNSLAAYAGTIAQMAVGIQVQTHGQFIADVYTKVIDNAWDD